MVTEDVVLLCVWGGGRGTEGGGRKRNRRYGWTEKTQKEKGRREGGDRASEVHTCS